MWNAFRTGLAPLASIDEKLKRRDALDEPVGPGARNHPADVARVERKLGSLGWLDPARASRPTGRFDSGLAGDVRAYQRRAGLKVDALLNPGGPTERSLDDGRARLRRPGSLLGPGRVELDADRAGENRRLADTIARTTNLGPLPTYIAEAAAGREKGRDEIVDLFRRVGEHGDDVAARLHAALAGHLDPTLHRTLFAEAREGAEAGDLPGTQARDPSGGPDRADRSKDDRRKVCEDLYAKLRAAQANVEEAMRGFQKASDDLTHHSANLKAAESSMEQYAWIFAAELVIPATRVISAVKAGKRMIQIAKRGFDGVIRNEEVPVPNDLLDATKQFLDLQKKTNSIDGLYKWFEGRVKELQAERSEIINQLNQAGCKGSN